MPSNDNFRTCICKHITPLDTCWAILRKFEKFWVILNNFEQCWAMFSNFQQLWAILSSFFGPAWVISSNFEHFCRASLGHVSNTIWHCRPWTVFKMSQLRLLWDILLWLKKVADVNPTDLDPKTRSVKDLWNTLNHPNEEDWNKRCPRRTGRPCTITCLGTWT